MAGRGTGIPLWFECYRSRREYAHDRYAFYDRDRGAHKVVRTGRTKAAPGRGNLPPRKLDTSHEYVCSCGHRGWSCHSGVMDQPLDPTVGMV